jgi:hypothetical protein
MITLLHEQRETQLPSDRAQGDALWLNASELHQATGWSLKPEGLCLGPVCVPVPAARSSQWQRDDRVDAAAMWQHMGHPVVHDAETGTWVLGTAAEQRGQALQSLEAPDFELPDLQGRLHKLSDYRGKKVFLTTWASW